MAVWKYAFSSAESAPNSSPILIKGDICANLRFARKIGYDGIEVHMREDTVLDYQVVAKTCEDTGILIAAVATGRLGAQGQVDLVSDQPYIIDAAMKGMLEYIKIATALKTDVIIGLIKGKIPNGADPKPYLARFARNLTQLCRHAADQGVRLYVEVINRYETNTLNTAREMLDFLNFWEIPNCYVHLDTYHMNIEETDPCEAIRLCKDRLGYFHVADNTRMYPGSGILDFKGYFSVLKEINYKGFVSVECLPIPDGETAVQKTLTHLRSCE